MGKRKRLHRQAVLAGKEEPFRASLDKPSREQQKKEMDEALAAHFKRKEKKGEQPTK